jgi:hypothetical protein
MKPSFSVKQCVPWHKCSERCGQNHLCELQNHCYLQLVLRQIDVVSSSYVGTNRFKFTGLVKAISAPNHHD